MNDQEKHIEKLIQKAAESEKSEDAIRFSQAACNIANTLCAVKASKLEK